MSSHAQDNLWRAFFATSINGLWEVTFLIHPLRFWRQYSHLKPPEEQLYALVTAQVWIKSKTPIFIITRRAIREALPINAAFTVSAAVYFVALDVSKAEAAHGDYNK